jgi:hypothetical protein
VRASGATRVFEREWEEPCDPGRLWFKPDPPRRIETETKRYSMTQIAATSFRVPRSRSIESNAAVVAERALTPISLLRLVRLLGGDADGDREEDDYGAITPSLLAFTTAAKLLQGAIKIMGEDVGSWPVVDSRGGIRITWRRGDRQVKLICPATSDAPPYIYQSHEDGSTIQNQNVTAEALAARLTLLTRREHEASERTGN